MRTPINNIGIFDDIPEPRYTNKKERPIMTELTPLALKLRTVYINSDATGDAFWNEMAEAVEDELVAPRPVRLPTVEEARQAIADNQGGDNQCWDTTPTSIRDIYVELAKAAADALGVTL